MTCPTLSFLILLLLRGSLPGDEAGRLECGAGVRRRVNHTTRWAIRSVVVLKAVTIGGHNDLSRFGCRGERAEGARSRGNGCVAHQYIRADPTLTDRR